MSTEHASGFPGERATPTGDEERFHVVVNHELQYSIWRADKPLPVGWAIEAVTGTKAQCLEYIEKVWTDMRPLSLRQQMAQSSSAN